MRGTRKYVERRLGAIVNLLDGSVPEIVDEAVEECGWMNWTFRPPCIWATRC